MSKHGSSIPHTIEHALKPDRASWEKFKRFLDPDDPSRRPPDPEREAMEGQERARLRGVIASLPPEQRRVVELAYFGGLSHSRIAESLGEPLGTVKTRLRLAMMKIRNALLGVDEMEP